MSLGNVSSYYHVSRVYEYALTLSRVVYGKAWTKILLFSRVVVVVCCFLTLTDPLRIQPWSQDRRNQTKSNRESEMSMESRHKMTDKK